MPNSTAAGVAVDDVDVLDRDAEAVGDDLRERRLVALAVAVRAGEHRHAAGRMHAHFARLEQPGARAERARDVRRRDAAGLDVRRVADAAQLAALRGLRLARRETGDVGQLHRLVQRRVVVAGVVEQRDRRLVREGADEVAPADLVLVDVQLARRGLDQALDDVGRLGPARAAIRVDRRGVGEHRGHFAVDRRRRVLARRAASRRGSSGCTTRTSTGTRPGWPSSSRASRGTCRPCRARARRA